MTLAATGLAGARSGRPAQRENSRREHPEGPEATRLGHRRGQLVAGDAAAHAGLDDRQLDAEPVQLAHAGTV